MNRLHIADPKKRDNVDRPAEIPDSVLQGVKKTGPTVKELQEEYGGAGAFYIPPEEHYQLENEDWRYDQFPEFFNGSNVLDFYDPDIEEKLKALEEEEDELLKMEALDDDLMGEESSNSDGVQMDDLKQSLKEVRDKKALFKLNHKMNAKLRAHPKNKKLSEMLAHFESKGIDINADSLRARSKSRRTIKDLEEAQSKLQKRVLDDSDDDDVVEDAKMNDEETNKRVGRKRTRATNEEDELMLSGDDKVETKSKGRRTLTPAQRSVTAKKMHLERSQSRREGEFPKRLIYKPVPEEHIRLAKKINTKRFRTSVEVSEADRSVTCKMPKHLFAGKMSNGSRNKR